MVLIKKINYSTKEGNITALFIILLNIPPILLTVIGTFLYGLQFMLTDKLYEWKNGTGSTFISTSILILFGVLSLYILLYIKTKIVNHYSRKKEKMKIIQKLK